MHTAQDERLIYSQKFYNSGSRATITAIAELVVKVLNATRLEVDVDAWERMELTLC